MYVYWFSAFIVNPAPGVIYEVACVQCGGPEPLAAAVARREVKKNGVFYYFPKQQVGAERKHTLDEEMSQQQERTQDEFRTYDSGIRAIVGDFTPAPALSFNAGSSSDGPPAITNGVVAVAMDSLKTKRDRLQKAIQLAEKCEKMVTALDSAPPKVSSELQVIMSLQETAEILQNEMGFSVKFGKDYKGTEITDASATAMSNKAEDITSKVVQAVKCIRALTGPGASRDLL